MATRIAITGASGFLGRHILRALMKRPLQITAITRHATRLKEFADRIQIVELDLSNPGDGVYERLGRPETLLHLAWDGLQDYRSLRHFEVELPYHYDFLKGLLVDGLESLLVTGTCFEYGLQAGPLSENLICRPSNPYGYAKDALRRQLQFLQLSLPFLLTWARVFYVFGEGQAKTSLWSHLNTALERGDATFPMSGDEQLRDYLPATEMAEYLARLTLLRQNIELVNVCSGRPRSVRNLVEDWVRQRGKTIELDLGHYPYSEYEPMAFWGDSRYLNQLMTQYENHPQPV